MDTFLPCFLVRHALSEQECTEVIAQAEAAGFGATGRDYPPSYRDNDRLVRDDAALAESLLRRLRPLLPEQLVDAEGVRWRLHGLNPRFRYCRYREGQRFCIHQDGAYAPSSGVRSQLTCMLYLNDAAQFTGGHTRYYAGRSEGSPLLGTVAPEAGTAIVFDHALWHDGEAVRAGTKYVMRTDVLYEREDARGQERPDVLTGHQGYVWCVRALRDGRLATASRDTTVRLWAPDGEGWRQDEILRGHGASVVALAEDAEGRLWSASRDRRLLRWSGARAQEMGRHEGAALCLTLLPDGRMASGGADRRIHVWGQEGRAALTLEGHTSWVWALASLPGGLLASASEDGTLRVWELARGVERSRVLVTEGMSFCSLAAGKDGVLFAGDERGGVTRLEPGGTQRRVQAHAGAVCALALTADGRLASGGEDDSVRVFRAEDLAPLTAHEHRGFVRSLVALPDGRIASASFDGTVRLWR